MNHPKKIQPLIKEAVRLHNAGKLAEATQLYLQVLAQDPKHFDAMHLAGVAAMQIGKPADAVLMISKALEIRASSADAWNNLGIAQQQLGQVDAAIESIRNALKYNARDVNALSNLANLLKSQGRYQEAEDSLRRAISLEPRHAVAHASLGMILYVTGRREAAENEVRQALTLDASLATAHNTLGLLLAARNEPAAALASYDTAISLQADYRDAYYNRATLQLSLGQFAAGWPHMYLHDPRMRTPTNSPPLPLDLHGKRICILRNQGIGDELFFLRFAATLKARGAHVLLQTETRMLGFARRLPFVDEVLSLETRRPAVDQVILVDHLPYFLQQGDTDVPPSIQLVADTPSIQRVALQLMQAGPPPYVGVTWRAGRMHAEVDFKREITEVLYKDVPVAQLGAQLQRWPGTVLILQRNPIADEVQRFNAALGRTAVDCSAVNNELEDMLALLSLIERYVTVSNTNLHLRVAAGLPCHVLIPWPPEWRWGLRTDRSPWFPHCPVYRQDIRGDWSAALTQLGNELLT